MKDPKGYLFYYDYAPNRKKKFLHRVTVEAFLGRKLEQSELVHHIDGNKTNNKIENLKLISRSSHAKEHQLGLGTHKRYVKKQKTP